MTDSADTRQAETTLIQGGTIIAFDGTEHRLLEDGVLAFTGDRIAHVGRSYDGVADRTIDGHGKMIIPGQISTHAHVSVHEGPRLLIDGGRRDFMRSGFLNYLPTHRDGGPSFFAHQDARASLKFGLAALIRNGVTTAVAFAPGGADGGRTIVELAGEMGIRLYFAPLATGGRYHADGEGRVRLQEDEPAGREQLERAGQFIEAYDGAHDGRLKGMVVLDEFYASTPGLRRAAKDLATRLGVGVTLHFVEQLREFHETLQRTGLTPAQLLAEEGFLGPEVILAHSLYVAGHSMTAYPYVNDLEVIGQSGSSVAHSPLAFARRGLGLESFQRYQEHGINLSLGTDTYPLDLFSEMRTASMVCKLVEQNHEAAGAMAVFRAANLGGAKALGRHDLGRLAPGAKADIVILDTENLQFGPNPDPIRALVHLATPQMVDTVIVDGRTLVAAKEMLVCDERQVLRDARRSSEAVWASFPECHWAGRTIEETFPPSIRPWHE